jgi:hypothetical protein
MQEESPLYSLDRKLGGIQSCSVRSDEGKISKHPCWEFGFFWEPVVVLSKYGGECPLMNVHHSFYPQMLYFSCIINVLSALD